jgi:hypothetical protein
MKPTKITKAIDVLGERLIQASAGPLLTLLADLEMLNVGRVSSLLSPTKGFDNRPPEGPTRGIAKAYASFLIDQLQHSGLSNEAACRKVVIGLESIKFRINGRPSTAAWKTVKGWRERISKLNDSDVQRSIYLTLRAQVDRTQLKLGKAPQVQVNVFFQGMLQKYGASFLE